MCADYPFDRNHHLAGRLNQQTLFFLFQLTYILYKPGWGNWLLSLVIFLALRKQMDAAWDLFLFQILVQCSLYWELCPGYLTGVIKLVSVGNPLSLRGLCCVVVQTGAQVKSGGIVMRQISYSKQRQHSWISGCNKSHISDTVTVLGIFFSKL